MGTGAEGARMLHARSLDSLEKARVFGMTQLGVGARLWYGFQNGERRRNFRQIKLI